MSVFASRVVRDFYGTETMRRIFSDDARVGKFLQVEVALAKVEAELGIIPREAYEEIARRAPDFRPDWDRLRSDTEAVGYPVMPFLRQFTEHCGAAGEYLHWGSTTRDITDTSFVLQAREALAVVDSDLCAVRDILIDLARTYRDTVTIGRTHGMHALPTTFGFRAAIWLAEVCRQIERLDRVRETFVYGQFGGAVGNLSALGSQGLAVQKALMAELGLQAPIVSWFAARDRVAEVVCTLAQVAGTMGSIAKTILVMTRNEVAEASEPEVQGRGTSSAMPHKHNTVASELVLVHARLVAQNAATVFDAMVQDYDRDWQGHFENVLVPQSFLLTHAAVTQVKFVLGGLRVHSDQMRRNLNLTGGLVMAESVMMALSAKTGRKRAHAIVSAASNDAIARDVPLREALLASADVTAHLTAAEIDTALEPASYLGSTGTIVDEMISRAQPRKG